MTQPGPTISRLERYGPAVITAGFFLYMAGFVILAPLENLLVRLPDDASYYFQIAHNLLAGRGSTFDGNAPTNGYQPLWMALLLPLFAVMPDDPALLLRATLLLQLALLALALRQFRRALATRLDPALRLPLTTLFLMLVVWQATNGMESAVLVLACGLLLRAALAWELAQTTFPLHLLYGGALLGLVILARLDSGMIAIAITLGTAWRIVRAPAGARNEVWRLAWLGLGAIILVLPYLLYNELSTGHIVPISGRLKSTFPEPLLGGIPRFLRAPGLIMALNLLMLAPCLAWLIAVLRRPSPHRDRFEPLVTTACAAVLLHALHTVLFMKGNLVFNWHFMLYPLVGMLAAIGLWERASMALRTRLRPALALLSLALMFGGGWRILERTALADPDRSMVVEALHAARWLQTHTPPDARLAMRDAGHLAWFSERQTVNLDGLVNSDDFQHVLRAGQLAHYLRGQGACLLVRNTTWDEPALKQGTYRTRPTYYPSHLYDVAADPLILRKNRERWRSRPTAAPGEPQIVIWDICP